MAGAGKDIRHVFAQEKRYKAFKLRMQGLSYEEIAEKVGYSARGPAYNAVQQVIRERALESKETVSELIDLQTSRLMECVKILWAQVEQGDVSSVAEVRKLTADISKLNGLTVNQVIEAVATDQIDAEIHELLTVIRTRATGPTKAAVRNRADDEG